MLSKPLLTDYQFAVIIMMLLAIMVKILPIPN